MYCPRYIQEIGSGVFVKSLFTKNYRFPEDFYLLDSGSSAIRFVLEFLKAKKDKQLVIGFPAYSCFSIYQSIVSSGNIPFLIDINPLEVRSGIDYSNLDVLLWVNYFGFDYRHFLEQVKRNNQNLLIVEDSTHVDFQHYLNGMEKVSDFVIFSFNFRKPIVSGGGGALYVNNKNYIKEIRDLYILLTEKKFTINQLKKVFIYNFSYNFLLFQLLAPLINSRRSGVLPTFSLTPPPQKIARYTRNILMHQIFSNKSNLYYSLTERYLQYIFKNEYKFSFYNYLIYYPILLSAEKDRDNLMQKLKIIGVDSFILWENMILNYKSVGIDLRKDQYTSTYAFFDNILFLPATLFRSRNKLTQVIQLIFKAE